MIERVIARSVGSEFDNRLSVVSTYHQSPAPQTGHQSRLAITMPEKDGDYVFSPVPMPRDHRTEIRERPRPALKKASIERHSESYFAGLATIHYVSNRVRIEILDDDDDEGPGQSHSSDNVRHEVEISYTVVPKWLPWSKGFRVSFLESAQGWFPGFTFRHFNVRPYDALIFELCSIGDIEGVKRLFRRGDASPFDTDPDGWTPLHVCPPPAHLLALVRCLLGVKLDFSNS